MESPGPPGDNGTSEDIQKYLDTFNKEIQVDENVANTKARNSPHGSSSN